MMHPLLLVLLLGTSALAQPTPCIDTNVRGPNVGCTATGDFDFTVIADVTMPPYTSGTNWLFWWGKGMTDDFHWLMASNPLMGQIGIWNSVQGQILDIPLQAYIGKRVILHTQYTSSIRLLELFADGTKIASQTLTGMLMDIDYENCLTCYPPQLLAGFHVGVQPHGGGDRNFEGTLHNMKVYEASIAPVTPTVPTPQPTPAPVPATCSSLNKNSFATLKDMCDQCSSMPYCKAKYKKARGSRKEKCKCKKRKCKKCKKDQTCCTQNPEGCVYNPIGNPQCATARG